jgi:hypothetical protein
MCCYGILLRIASGEIPEYGTRLTSIAVIVALENPNHLERLFSPLPHLDLLT